jgi:tetratricopeptide (TPR) repeat protein
MGSWREHLAEKRDAARSLDPAASAYDAAIAANPPEAAYREAAGFLAERRAAVANDRAQRKHFLAVAEQRYREALARRPGAAQYLVDLARIETMRAQTVDPRLFDVADRRWAVALRADPNDWEVRNLRALSLTEWANASSSQRELLVRAAAGFESVIELRPDLPDAWKYLIRVVVALDDHEQLLRTIRRAAVALDLDFGALARFTRRLQEAGP